MDKKRLKVSVIAWDLAHNPLGRAYLIADVLRNDYDVEIIGSTFPRFGNDIWKPLRDCSRVPIRSFPGDDFPAHFTRMQALAENIDGDALFVSKPRLPSLELAILAKIRRNRPIILDIDDHELSFFENREPLSLEQLKASRRTLDVDVPYGEAWTRYSETLIPHVDHITVSNKELRKKYGGTILPHIRDERDFDPAPYPRDAIRRALGFASEDRVILFAGTPRMHKGLSRLANALRELDRPTYKLLIVGTPADGDVAETLRRVDPSRVLFRRLFDCRFPGLFQAIDAQISHIIRSLPDRGSGFFARHRADVPGGGSVALFDGPRFMWWGERGGALHGLKQASGQGLAAPLTYCCGGGLAADTPSGREVVPEGGSASNP